MDNKKKITKLQYEAAIKMHGFKSVSGFCDHYGLNNSTVTKIINGDSGYCGDSYIERLQSLIREELDHVISYQGKSISSPGVDQAVVV